MKLLTDLFYLGRDLVGQWARAVFYEDSCPGDDSVEDSANQGEGNEPVAFHINDYVRQRRVRISNPRFDFTLKLASPREEPTLRVYRPGGSFD